MSSLDLDTLFRVAEAIEFDEQAAHTLTTDPEVAARLRELLSVRGVVAAEEMPSPLFVEDTLGRLPVTPGAAPSPQPGLGRSTWTRWPTPATGAFLTGVLAALATFFALLATGGGAAGGPVPIAAIAVVAGAGAALQSVGGYPGGTLRSR